MMSKSILITGCSSGIGYDAAHTLHKRGWQVFASCRKEEDCARLHSEGLVSPLIDYEKPETIESGFAKVLDATGGTLDALFNNGAYAVPGLVEDLPTDALRAIFEANFFGYHDLTRRAIPAMRKAGGGRILQCSSVLGFAALRFRGAYNSTKFALEGLNDTMRLEMHDQGIHVVLIEPGPITTKIRENSIPHFEKWIDHKNSARPEFYKAVLHRLYDTPTGPDTFELPPSAVTQKVIHALESRKPRARYRVTTATHLMAFFKRLLPTSGLDWVARKL